ncbi:MAG TPA: hypothetical protein PKA00_20085, partial [Saprospiraceae bacterium]|nr:hypothetical protein [Saprospiraceae bacterium]
VPADSLTLGKRLIVSTAWHSILRLLLAGGSSRPRQANLFRFISQMVSVTKKKRPSFAYWAR